MEEDKEFNLKKKCLYKTCNFSNKPKTFDTCCNMGIKVCNKLIMGSRVLLTSFKLNTNFNMELTSAPKRLLERLETKLASHEGASK